MPDIVNNKPASESPFLTTDWRHILNRQAYGADFAHKQTDESVVEQLLAGQMHLSPHPVWEMPEQIRWTEDPFRQRNWRFQLHTLRWLEPIRRVSLRRNNEKLAETWWRYVESWIDANPPANPASRWAWVDMADGLRGIVLAQGLAIISDARRQEKLLVSLRSHLDWLLDPDNYAQGNHAMHQNSGAWVLSLLIGSPPEKRTVLDRISVHLANAFDADGVNEEGSLAYQLLNRRWWLEMRHRLEIENVALPEEFERIEKLPIFLAHATRPDGRLEQLGDTDVASAEGISNHATEYATTNGQKGAPPQELHRTFSRGWIFGRDTWGEDSETTFANATFYSIRFGPQNAIHGHEDGGSVTFYAGGSPLLVDGGRYNYSSDPLRKYFVGRRSHNSVVVLDREVDRSARVELITETHTAEGSVYEFSDTSYESVQITRRVAFGAQSGWLIVVDEVNSEAKVTAEQGWNFLPDVVNLTEQFGYSIHGPSGTYHLRSSGKTPTARVTKGATQPVEGWISLGWQQAVPCSRVAFIKAGHQFRFVSALIPQSESDDEAIVFQELRGQKYLVSGRHGLEVFDIRTGTTRTAPKYLKEVWVNR